MDEPRPAWEWPDDEFVEYAQARQHTLLRAAYLVCGDPAVAERVVRSALGRLARQWQHVREEQPELFVRRAMYRDAVASWRHRPAEPVRTTAAPDEPDQPWDAEEVERRREVLQALDTLSARQRAVVVLLWFEERGEHEAAQVLGCSVAAVLGDADAALSALRAALPRVDLQVGGTR